MGRKSWHYPQRDLQGCNLFFFFNFCLTLLFGLLRPDLWVEGPSSSGPPLNTVTSHLSYQGCPGGWLEGNPELDVPVTLFRVVFQDSQLSTILCFSIILLILWWLWGYAIFLYYILRSEYKTCLLKYVGNVFPAPRRRGYISGAVLENYWKISYQAV